MRSLATAGVFALLMGTLGITAASASTTIYLNPSQVGSVVTGNGTCPMIPGFDAWHFVAPGKATFVSLDVTFQDGNTDPLPVAAIVLQSDPKHAYVYTRVGQDAMLVSGSAVIEGSASQFVLSHTCDGAPGDSVATATSTTASAATIDLGASVHDNATVTSGTDPVQFADPAGTVSFSYCYSAVDYPATCPSGTAIGTGPVTLANGEDKYDGTATASSADFVPDAPGFYLLYAAYNGDATFAGSNDGYATTERVHVLGTPGPVGTTTVTSVSPTTADLGASVTDSATVTATSGSDSPTGTVTFSYCYDADTAITTCAGGTALTGGMVTLSAGAAGTATASFTWTPTNGGYYVMHAVYSGDDGFSGSVDDSTNEAFHINGPTFVLRYGDIPRMIDTGSTTARKCPSSSVGGRSIGAINAVGVSVPVKSTWYPRHGVFAPARSAKIAGVSTRHQPLSATEGTTVIGWHVRWNPGCNGTLNPLVQQRVGYEFTTRDANGRTTRWAITERHLVNKGGYKRDWFTLNGPRQLVLITCAGYKNGKFHKNFVIVATPVSVG